MDMFGVRMCVLAAPPTLTDLRMMEMRHAVAMAALPTVVVWKRRMDVFARTLTERVMDMFGVRMCVLAAPPTLTDLLMMEMRHAVAMAALPTVVVWKRRTDVFARTLTERVMDMFGIRMCVLAAPPTLTDLLMMETRRAVAMAALPIAMVWKLSFCSRIMLKRSYQLF